MLNDNIVNFSRKLNHILVFFRNESQIPKLLTNPVVTLVANNHNVTTAQVLLRFWVQQGVICIPKSVTPDRIKTNRLVWVKNYNFFVNTTFSQMSYDNSAIKKLKKIVCMKLEI